MSDVFDIADGRNRYEPCPKCKAIFGMGLTTRSGRLAVECDCGHRGPEIEVPLFEQWSTWPVSWHQRDRQAFDAWNVQPRDSLSTERV